MPDRETLTTKDGKRWGGQVHPHAVYRMYASGGELLYIGCTVDIVPRLRDHMCVARAWIHQVSRIELEWHPDFMTAREAEERAIAAEAPRHNTDGTPWGHGRYKGLPRTPRDTWKRQRDDE